MVEVPKADQELRFRNVTLHSQGRREHGTLYLFRHHMLFSYLPEGQKHSTRPSFEPTPEKPAISAESSSLTEASVASAESKESEGRKPQTHKQRPKEIWVPYPMISHCVLRPSHLQGQVLPNRDDVGRVNDEDEQSELFPPVFGTASYERPSTDSSRLAPYASPQRPSSPNRRSMEAPMVDDHGRQPAIRIRRKDMQMLALHFHPTQAATSPDDAARQAFLVLRSRCCVDRVEDLHAFHYRPPKVESETDPTVYDPRREFARMGISPKAAEGPGAAWRISDINWNYDYSSTYPKVLCVPRAVSDNMLKYGGAFRSRSRIPCLAYLHSNGGSITRSSQPMVGVQNKRNPQDERLVSAIFSSHTPTTQSPADSPPGPTAKTPPSSTTLDSTSSEAPTLDGDVPELPLSNSDPTLNEKVSEKAAPARKKVYGSTRRNLIVDARPKINALANRATGGGIEDVSNYSGNGAMPTERVFLNIANIHVMRSSLDKVFESFANSDYIKMKPDQEMLRKSGWLSHIANMLDGSEMVARVVGLGGSHVLVHCSDGWDRTAQVSALAQIMLDPYYRTFDGFITLVQKDFLSFGHKFRDRNGIQGSEKWFEIENERLAPSRNRENNSSDPNSLNALSAKAFTGAKNWLEKNRGSLFRQQNSSKDSLGEQSPSRPSSPPPNPVIHSPPSASGKEDKEQRVSDKEISPIFHQLLDGVYQLQYQCPTAFEFNERFLRRLFYHVYACQYGEFLFNTERERSRYAGKVPSVWSHFVSRRLEFINHEYIPKVDDPLLFPKRCGPEREVEVRWWHDLFRQKDEDMNLPRALAPADPPAMSATFGSRISFDDQALENGKSEATGPVNGSIKESKSTPSLTTAGESASNSLSALNIQSNDTKAAAATEHFTPSFHPAETALQAEEPKEPPAGETSSRSEPNLISMEAMEYDGDPLGVTSSKPVTTDKLDFAAFASQNAFRDR
jgi:myotubularin-related protein 6/7/8